MAQQDGGSDRVAAIAPGADEAALVRRSQGGDQQAFAVLVQAYQGNGLRPWPCACCGILTRPAIWPRRRSSAPGRRSRGFAVSRALAPGCTGLSTTSA